MVPIPCPHHSASRGEWERIGKATKLSRNIDNNLQKEGQGRPEHSRTFPFASPQLPPGSRSRNHALLASRNFTRFHEPVSTTIPLLSLS